jgi:hypothetical protein
MVWRGVCLCHGGWEGWSQCDISRSPRRAVMTGRYPSFSGCNWTNVGLSCPLLPRSELSKDWRGSSARHACMMRWRRGELGTWLFVPCTLALAFLGNCGRRVAAGFCVAFKFGCWNALRYLQ